METIWQRANVDSVNAHGLAGKRDCSREGGWDDHVILPRSALLAHGKVRARLTDSPAHTAADSTALTGSVCHSEEFLGLASESPFHYASAKRLLVSMRRPA